MIKILSLNAQLLPSFARTSSVSIAEQARDLGDWLVAQRCDVICLQEVFSDSGATLLRDRLVAFHGHIALPYRVLVEDNGLLIASRYPFVGAPAHHVWREAEHAHERASSKGFTHVTLDLSDSATPMLLGLTNLHMHADYEPHSFAGVRARQIEQLRAALPHLVPADTDGLPFGLVTLGDFNIVAEDDGVHTRSEYTALRERLGQARDLFRDFAQADPGHTCGNDRIDFALAPCTLGDVTLAPLYATHAAVLPAPHSDHRALSLEVTAGAAPPPRTTPSPTPSDTDRASSLPPRDPLTPIQPTARPGLSELDAIIDRLFRDPSFLAVLARLDRPKPPPTEPDTWLGTARPNTLSALRKALEIAHGKAPGRRFLNAVGAERSPSDIRSTIGIKLSLGDLAHVAFATDPDITCFEGGASIGTINSALHPTKVLIAQPGSGQLTYVGCMSVGGHGSGTTRGALAAQVRALCVMGHDGVAVTRHQVEPRGSALPLMDSGAVRLADDDLFRACTVNIGLLGVVSHVAVDNEPSYHIREHRWEARPEQDLASLVAGLRAWNDRDLHDDEHDGVVRGKPHSFELWLDPYSDCTIVGQRWRTDAPLRGARRLALNFNGWGGLEWLMNTLDETGRLDLSPRVVSMALRLVTQDDDYVLTAAQGLDFGANNGLDMRTCAVSVRAEDCAAAIAEIKRLCHEMADQSVYLTSPIGVRFVRGYAADSSPWLAPQFEGLTAMIEIAGFRQVRCSNEALSRAMRVLFDRFGARLHWGQTLPAWLGPRELRTMYPETSIDAFVRARGVLDKRNLFGNALSRRLQLDPR